MRTRNALVLSAALAVTAMAPAACAAVVPAFTSPAVVAAHLAAAPGLAPDMPSAPAVPLPAPAGDAPVGAPRDVGTGGGAKPAPALPSRIQPKCGDGKSAEFPIGARIRGGPSVYRSGGGAQTWYLDLTNTTRTTCEAVHPVVVFTDRDRALKARHLLMDFTDRGTGRTHAVTLEQSDEDEVIAVFDGGGDGFPGFTIPPGGSVTVTVHLGFTEDAPPGEVVADAALVQRKADDGDWVGESGGYRFTVEGPEEPAAPGAAGSLASTGPGTGGRDAVLAGAAAVLAVSGAGFLVAARRLRRR
ncbi:hypothetical protein ACIQUQ_16840 [Streptomyces sp. NPDC101118]|uniref:hypothetical protein n=1 Tax=Streptomyces sp. NPDC101118 TaxID=3366109 RepID=UPI0038013E81